MGGECQVIGTAERGYCRTGGGGRIWIDMDIPYMAEKQSKQTAKARNWMEV